MSRNLFAFCVELVEQGNYDADEIADLLMKHVEQGSSWDQKWSWDLLREAGSPLIHKQGFLEAARLALEIAYHSDPPPTPTGKKAA